MTGNLMTALQNLLIEFLPTLLGGNDPPITVTITPEHTQFVSDPTAKDTTTSAPRPDDQVDSLPFNIENPAGPYRLTQPPYPGPRRVRLVTEEGDRIPLQAGEIIWDEQDPQTFSLNLRRDRPSTGITQVEIRYGVTAVFTTLHILQRLVLTLQPTNPNQSDLATTHAQLDQAEALAIAVIELNRPDLVAAAQVSYESDRYSATTRLLSLRLVESHSTPDSQRLIRLKAEAVLKATRALGEIEGMAIERVLLHSDTFTALRA